VLAVSAWLGTLAFVVGVGVPETRRADGGGTPALAAMVNVFSPVALVAAGTVAATGVISAAFQLGALSPLWTSAYGRTLLLKLAAVALVIAAGAYNWRRLKPALADGARADRLRASGGGELIAGAIVLLITAILVAVPTP
jgi:putative copper export protein